MSSVKNDSFQKSYGEVVSSAEMNNKFTDMETATADIDADNIRSEGVDRVNITGTPVLKALQYSWNNYRNPSGGGFAYNFFTRNTRTAGQKSLHQLQQTGTGGDSVLFLTSDGTTSGTPTTLALGDLLRIKFSFNFYSDSTLFDSQDSVVPRTQSAAFIIFPAYKETNGGSWEAFPHGIDWFKHGADGPSYDTGTNTGQVYACPSSDDPATSDGTRDDGVVIVTTDGFSPSGVGAHVKEIQAHGCLNLVIRGFNAFDIHTIGFWMVGPLYFHDTSPFSGGGRGWEIVDDGAAGYLARVERANFMAQVIQKGEGVTP